LRVLQDWFRKFVTNDSYTQSVKVSTGSKSTGGNYTYTWTYVIAPTEAEVAPFKAWNLIDSSGNGLVHIVVNGDSFPGTDNSAPTARPSRWRRRTASPSTWLAATTACR